MPGTRISTVSLYTSFRICQHFFRLKPVQRNDLLYQYVTKKETLRNSKGNPSTLVAVYVEEGQEKWENRLNWHMPSSMSTLNRERNGNAFAKTSIYMLKRASGAVFVHYAMIRHSNWPKEFVVLIYCVLAKIISVIMRRGCSMMMMGVVAHVEKCNSNATWEKRVFVEMCVGAWRPGVSMYFVILNCPRQSLLGFSGLPIRESRRQKEHVWNSIYV